MNIVQQPFEAASGSTLPFEAVDGAQISGKSVLGLQHYLTRHHGEGAFDRVLLRLPDAERAAFSGIILPTQWYPTSTIITAMEIGRDLFGPTDFFERCGEESARYAINSFYRFLLRFKTPHWILQRSTGMWRQFHSTGLWEMQMTENSFEGELKDFALPGTYCRVLVGWIRGAGRLTGARNAEVTHPWCRNRGSPRCLFVARWR
jgi:hypothetical protein